MINSSRSIGSLLRRRAGVVTAILPRGRSMDHHLKSCTLGISYMPIEEGFMKAVRIHEYGDTSVLKYEDAPDPKADFGEVVVKGKACALNHLDLWIRKGMPKAPALPHILGSDIAGEVAEVGPGTPDVKTGMPVLLQPAVSCGVCAQCIAGEDNLCKDYGIIGAKTLGGNAQYVKVPRVNLMPMPKGLS